VISIFHQDAAVSLFSRSVARRWRSSLWAFSLSFAAILLLALLLPNRYTSHLKLLVKNERANSLINVGDQTQGVLYLNDVSEAQISTEIELLTSADLLRKVVERCELANTVAAYIKDPAKREEIAVRDLAQALKVASAHRSAVIEVTYESRDPRQSARVLSAVSEIYLTSHLELHGASGSYAFFNSLWTDTSAKLSEAESKLDEFRQSAHITALPQEKVILLQNIADLEKQMAVTTAGAKKSEQEAYTYQELMAKTPMVIERERRTIPNQEATQQLGTLLVTLQNKRAEAITRYRPEDRIIGELDAQIKQTQVALDHSATSPSQEVATAQNPLFLDTESELVHARAGFAGASAQADSLGRQIRSDQQRLQQLGAATTTYDDLSRWIEELSSLTETYRKSRDEAKVGELLDKQKLSNVAVVEGPMIENLPSSPRRGIIVALGFLWSLAVAGGTALFLDLKNPRIRSMYELDQVEGLPLLGEIGQHAAVPFLAREFPEIFMSMQRIPMLSLPEEQRS
jgi:uncharacterized protein involved in exopolysaccharide biosynthesis